MKKRTSRFLTRAFFSQYGLQECVIEKERETLGLLYHHKSIKIKVRTMTINSAAKAIQINYMHGTNTK
jgi:hypothetical protein